MTPKTFDVVVIGAGSAGLTTAVGLTKVGKRVLLIEREHMGGECTNSGCIPSKALLHHAKQYWHATTTSGITPQGEAYRTSALAYVQSKIKEILTEETPEHFTKLGITVVLGEAHFVDKNSVRVGETTYRFAKAVIATGSQPRSLVVTGLLPDTVLTNQNIFSLTTIPERLLIVGAGPIGMELGQAFAMLGSIVTLATTDTELGKLEDPALRPFIAKQFSTLGVEVLYGVNWRTVENGSAVFDRASGETVTVPFDKILIAIGRVPALPNGLTQANISFTEYGIIVNHNFRTTNPNVYAIGDVSAKLKFTHVADDSARQLVGHIASYGLFGIKTKAVPKVTYTEPEIAQVGLSQSEAEIQHGAANIVRITIPLSLNDRARTDSATAGVLIVIAKRLTGKILGAHMVGPRAGEVIATITLAMDNKLSLWKLRKTIYAYPTYSLLLKKAGDLFFATQFANLRTDLLALFRSTAPKITIALLWLLGIYALYAYKSSTGLSTEAFTLAIFTFISASVWGPLLYILLYTIRPLTFFPGAGLSILSGVFFGFTYGCLYTVIGANLSAALAYVVGRYFAGTEKTAVATGPLARFAGAMKHNTFTTILTMRMIFLPFDVVNYGAGLLRLPFVPYLTATFVGTLLGVATFVAIGASISVEELTKNGFSVSAIDSRFLMLSVIIFVLSIGIARLFKKS